jgi:hypothetical protein
MKTKLTTTTGMVGAVLLLAAGCGGSGPPTGGALVTHTLVSNVSDSVAVGDCVPVEGPYSLGAGTTAFNLLDTPVGIGSDSMEVVILPDAVWASEGCNFTVGQTALDDQQVQGSDSASGVPIDADSYDFVVACNNAIDDCFFTLSWNATY